ncbi:hypothetical protein OROHE_025455 [Orobanche hederae]
MYDCGSTDNETDIAFEDDDEVDLVGEDSDKEPKVRMKFKSAEDMWELYKLYAYKMGFPVKKRNSRTFSDGELRNVTYTCGREGLMEHPSKSRLMSCNGDISNNVKRRIVLNDTSGIPVNKTYISKMEEQCQREYMRAKVYYAGLAPTASQDRYDDLCRKFSGLADIVADDEAECGDLKEWITSRKAGVTLNNGRSRHASNHVGHGNGHEELDTGAGPHIKDPKYVKSKGAPRRVRRKGPLENGYKNQKATSKMKRKAQQVIETTPCATVTSLTQFSEPQWRDPSMPLRYQTSGDLGCG